MALGDVEKSFEPNKRDFKLTSKDFNQYRDNLIEFTKTYFPKTFNDFNSTSLGMMFIEQASAIGDILSFYIDYSFKESLMLFAEERKNILSLARYLGFVPPASFAANTLLDVFQLIPSIGVNGDPDFRFALQINQGMEVSSNDNSEGSVVFRTTSDIDFAADTKDSPREVSVFQRDSAGKPEFYLLKKSINARSAQVKTKIVSVGDAIPFFQITLDDPDVIEILDVIDSDGNRWYEVPFLAQDLVFIEDKNTRKNNFTFSKDQKSVPSLLKGIKTPRRFIRKINAANTTQLEFGAGTIANSDEVIVPSLDNVSIGGGISLVNDFIDPSNFLKTDTIGQAPSNIDLTVRYAVGGGVKSNAISNTITAISSVDFGNDISVFANSEVEVFNFIRDNISANNPNPAEGGRGPLTDEEVRRIALGTIGAQSRNVTPDDYAIRSLAMPARFGAVAKTFVAKDSDLDLKTQREMIERSNTAITPETFNNIFGDVGNPLAVNLYVLTFDQNRKLTNVNSALIQNLKTWLGKTKMLNDAVNILNGFIINVGINFDIVVFEDELKKEVLGNAIKCVQRFFDIDKWLFNDPIDLSGLELAIASVKGVKSVPRVEIKNLNRRDGEYSDIEYDISNATRNKVVFPSRDPSIFEVKFPNQDIRGKVV